ncbi:hypothetical protein DEALK_17290 [Dehalogenimonas alkenigignens]|uniref:Uncharacterized protein n=1 Tax=Dehalogenimonas alkenigignens TaxID=1217799 RepID=A0A0W0GK34_9CHLR|nr:hypothetical protein [Dehalogenimonas alkenigignens]KTB48882.1 hypothetical protein DEALK_17290 [Dehalogenimonas alkenigignens]
MTNANGTEVNNADFVGEWAEHWCHMVDLFINILRTDKPASERRLPSPTENDSYVQLRNWFGDHEVKFRGLWGLFCETRLDTLELEHAWLRERWQNPFQFFYQSETIHELFVELGVQQSPDVEWNPNEDKSWEVTVTGLQLGAILAEFFVWAGGETGE